jgi:hypothetical protein
VTGLKWAGHAKSMTPCAGNHPGTWQLFAFLCRRHVNPACMKAFLQILLVALALLGGVSKSFAPFIAGWVQVNILPAGAVAAGAQWSIDAATPVHDSGTAYPTTPGIHTVYYTDTPGWITPASVEVTVTQGQTNVINGTYVTTGNLVLTVRLTTTNTVVVSWPSPSTNWNLQQNTNLATMNWVTPPQKIGDDGTNKFIIVSPSAGKMFYRLKK